MMGSGPFGLFHCKECKSSSIYTLTSKEILDHWDEFCRDHQMAAKLAAESMLPTLKAIAEKQVRGGGA